MILNLRELALLIVIKLANSVLIHRQIVAQNVIRILFCTKGDVIQKS